MTADRLIPRAILETFDGLLEQAKASPDPEPTAMTVATASPDGQPSARTVLLKHVDERGFVFYTNFESRKGRQLAINPRASLLFHWRLIDNGIQVQIEGEVEIVSDAEADAYFASRPRPSQIGAWASLQSQTLASREEFEARIDEVEARYDGAPVPRPPHWSGFRVRPVMIEFWHGARYRLHDRQRHEFIDGQWRTRMLYP